MSVTEKTLVTLDPARLQCVLDGSKLSIRSLADLIAVDESKIRRALKGQTIRFGIVERIAAQLGVQPASLRIASHWDFALIGLKAQEPRSGDCDKPFQNLIDDGDNNCAISYLWASAEGSEIIAKTMLLDGWSERVLRVSFQNAEDTFPSNVSVHPQTLVARKRRPEQRYLTFKSRLVEPKRNANPFVRIAIRVGDARLQQWEYRESGESYILCTVPDHDDDPEPFCIDLDSPKKWAKFYSAGHVPGLEPDFSALTTVVFEVGRGTPYSRPGAGSGSIDIWDIRLVTREIVTQ